MSQLNELTEQILEFIRERDWTQFHSGKDLAISLSLEASELLEIFQWSPEEIPPEQLEAKRALLADELSDVLYWTLLISQKYGIDLEEAFLAKLAKNREKYPVEKATGSSKKYDEL